MGLIGEFDLQLQNASYPKARGLLTFMQGPSGITIHATDAVSTDDLAARFILPKAFSVTVFLGGHSDVFIDGQQIPFGAEEGKPHIQIRFNEKNVVIDRCNMPGKRMRKVNITIREQALEAWLSAGFDFKKLCSEERVSGVYFRDWTPASELVIAAQAIIDIGAEPDLHQQIELERLALSILDGIISLELPTSVDRHLAKAQQAKNYIDENLFEDLTLPALAKAIGMSVSNLQRSFKAAFHCTTMTYMRKQRLQHAYRLLRESKESIGEIATTVGYNNVTNFSSAFSKEFGVSPSSVKAVCRSYDT